MQKSLNFFTLQKCFLFYIPFFLHQKLDMGKLRILDLIQNHECTDSEQ